MGTNDPRVDAYIAKSADFAKPILKHLRKVVHAGCVNVEETIKWGFPHFDYKGVMCGMAGFKDHCSFGFWKAALIFGTNETVREGMGHLGKITSISDVPDEKTLIAYVRKAGELNEKGIKAPDRSARKKKKPLAPPAYFDAALAKNSKARKTFDDFSPSHRREYIEWITEAKRKETRQQRLATSIKWLAEGKPRNWKYMPGRK